MARGYCNKHYQRWRKHGNALYERPVGCKIKNGYIQESRGGVVKFQHRWIMEEYLGRELFDHENVHHKNGVRDDNRLENLELWSTSQPKGQKVEDKIAWMKDFLNCYGMVVVDVV